MAETVRQRARKSKDPAVLSMSDELDTLNAIEALSLSEGGKVLTNLLIKDIISAVEALATRHSDLTLQQFISYSSKIKEKLDLVRIIARSKDNKKFITDEINSLLEQALPE